MILYGQANNYQKQKQFPGGVLQACSSIKKENRTQVFSCKLGKNIKNTPFYRTPPMAASAGTVQMFHYQDFVDFKTTFSQLGFSCLRDSKQIDKFKRFFVLFVTWLLCRPWSNKTLSFLFVFHLCHLQHTPSEWPSNVAPGIKTKFKDFKFTGVSWFSTGELNKNYI